MPTAGIKTGTYRISKTINAPLPFVYEWCTDFRDDDTQLTGSKSIRHVVEKTEKRVVYVVDYKVNGKDLWHASVIALNPPNSWHLETACDKYEDEIGEYNLTKLGKGRTRLDMVFRMRYKNPPYKIDTKKEWEEDTSRFWDKLIAALDRDYAKSKAS
ncbi:MAG: hypothetical protein ACRECH_02355 [Nitrososphaerales archaeon]